MARPNILWIVTTQWRAGAFGHAGDPNARTPRIDALAGEGIRFGEAVTPHPFGPFARAAMLTGMPSPENGIRDYYDPLPAGMPTIAGTLVERGYATAFFGKWHLASRDPKAPVVGEAHARMIVPDADRGGFEFWEGFESGFLLNDPWLHGTRLPEPTRFRGYQSEVICGRAADSLRKGDFGLRNSQSAVRSPHFAIVSLEAPHPPYDAPVPEGVVRPDPGGIELPGNVLRGGDVEARARRELAGYYAHIEATDRAIGRLVDAVDEADKALGTETVIVFTSVHGDMHGAHGLFRKGWPYEESIRVPLIVRRGADRKPETTRSAVSLLDLPAMTLAWVEGREVAFRQMARISMPSVVPFRDQCDRVWRGIRTPSRKLVLNDDGSPWLFFDLERDPLEHENLAADRSRAAEIEELAKQV